MSKLSGLPTVIITRSSHAVRRLAGLCLAALSMGLALSGCHLKDSSSPSTSTTETFAGTLAPQGSNAYTITVAQAGTVSITLTSIGPPSTVAVRLGIGTPGGTATAPTSTPTRPI